MIIYSFVYARRDACLRWLLNGDFHCRCFIDLVTRVCIIYFTALDACAMIRVCVGRKGKFCLKFGQKSTILRGYRKRDIRRTKRDRSRPFCLCDSDDTTGFYFVSLSGDKTRLLCSSNVRALQFKTTRHFLWSYFLPNVRVTCIKNDADVCLRWSLEDYVV